MYAIYGEFILRQKEKWAIKFQVILFHPVGRTCLVCTCLIYIFEVFRSLSLSIPFCRVQHFNDTQHINKRQHTNKRQIHAFRQKHIHTFTSCTLSQWFIYICILFCLYRWRCSSWKEKQLTWQILPLSWICKNVPEMKSDMKYRKFRHNWTTTHRER